MRRRSHIIGCRLGCNEPDIQTSIKLAKMFEEAGVEYILRYPAVLMNELSRVIWMIPLT